MEKECITFVASFVRDSEVMGGEEGRWVGRWAMDVLQGDGPPQPK